MGIDDSYIPTLQSDNLTLVIVGGKFQIKDGGVGLTQLTDKIKAFVLMGI